MSKIRGDLWVAVFTYDIGALAGKAVPFVYSSSSKCKEAIKKEVIDSVDEHLLNSPKTVEPVSSYLKQGSDGHWEVDTTKVNTEEDVERLHLYITREGVCDWTYAVYCRTVDEE
jgi:hypothetical protein